jgi:hypothetical protein
VVSDPGSILGELVQRGVVNLAVLIGLKPDPLSEWTLLMNSSNAGRVSVKRQR